jgi:hypothetical protein
MTRRTPPLRRRDHEPWQIVSRDVERLARSDGQLIVGPWLSELGFEVLYWIPFVTWLQQRFELPPERLVVVSRGGVSSWYGALVGTYLDLLDGFTEDEFRHHTEERWQSVGGQKQMAFGPFDREALRRVGLDVDRHGRGVLHPSLMYNLFRGFWRGRDPIASVIQRTAYDRLQAPDWPEIAARLPDGEFFAVKFYARPSFPDSLENRAVVRRVVDRLAERAPVALLQTGLQLDDHREFATSTSASGHEIFYPLQGVPADRNLEAQSAILGRASALFGTYGGFSYLSPAYGVPSFAYYSAPEHFLRSHLAVARRAATQLGSSITLVDARSSPVLTIAGL